MAWSTWRQKHQGIARACHHRRHHQHQMTAIYGCSASAKAPTSARTRRRGWPSRRRHPAAGPADRPYVFLGQPWPEGQAGASGHQQNSQPRPARASFGGTPPFTSSGCFCRHHSGGSHHRRQSRGRGANGGRENGESHLFCRGRRASGGAVHGQLTGAHFPSTAIILRWTSRIPPTR